MEVPMYFKDETIRMDHLLWIGLATSGVFLFGSLLVEKDINNKGRYGAIVMMCGYGAFVVVCYFRFIRGRIVPTLHYLRERPARQEMRRKISEAVDELLPPMAKGAQMQFVIINGDKNQDWHILRQRGGYPFIYRIFKDGYVTEYDIEDDRIEITHSTVGYNLHLKPASNANKGMGVGTTDMASIATSADVDELVNDLRGLQGHAIVKIF